MNTKKKKTKWDSQLRKGLLDFVILLYLQKKEFYGYELIRELKHVTNIELSEGTIYPLLNRLKKEELISAKWVEMETGVPRKYYRITEKGRKAVKDMRITWEQIVLSIQKLMETT